MIMTEPSQAVGRPPDRPPDHHPTDDEVSAFFQAPEEVEEVPSSPAPEKESDEVPSSQVVSWSRDPPSFSPPSFSQDPSSYCDHQVRRPLPRRPLYDDACDSCDALWEAGAVAELEAADAVEVAEAGSSTSNLSSPRVDSSRIVKGKNLFF